MHESNCRHASTHWLIYAQATKKHEEWVESRRSRLDKK